MKVRLLCASVLMVLLCVSSWAQSTAQINGTVKDQTGAVLPGVEVAATQTDTGLKRNVVTDETGSYILTNLPVGPYRLEAALPGFRTYVQTGIVLQVGSNPTLNAVLEVGQVADQVEVQADAALVETRSTGVGTVIDNVRVLELPLNGRNAQELILLSGAAIGGGVQKSSRSYPTDAISVAGGLDNGLTYTLDGGTHNDPFNNLNLPMPFPDALQEFKLETSAVPAQYGQHSSGVVNAVTKSGTNQLHGDLFEFVRNGALNARNAFALKNDGLKRNQFGGTLGGPIVQNKLFFFGGYQGTIERAAPSDLRSYVPTPAMLAGDWTTVASSACRTRPVTLRAPFVNNRIDPALFTGPALNLIKRIPATTDPCGEIRYGRRANSTENFVIGKVDYQRSEKHSLFARYQIGNRFLPTDYDGVNQLSFAEANVTIRAQSFILGDTYLIGDSTVSSFRGTLIRTLADRTSPDFWTFSDLGIKNVTEPPGFKMAFVNITDGFNNGSQPGTPSFSNSTGFQFAEDLSLVRGAHQVAFGANFIHTKINLMSVTKSPGQFTFDGTQTGLGLGDLMLGKPIQWYQVAPANFYLRQNYIGLYAQDTWKATSRLTMNAGLRWEPYLPAWEKRGRVFRFNQTWFDQGLRSTVYKKAPAGLMFPGDMLKPDGDSMSGTRWLHFTPRFGLAWDPQGDGRMTVRGAYGVFFDYPHFYRYQYVRDSPPGGYYVTVTDLPGGFEDPWQAYPGGNPFPVVLSPELPFPLSGSYVNVPYELKMPYVHQWNLSVQRQIGTDWLVAGNYIGNSVIHVMNDSDKINAAVYLPGASCVIAGRTFNPCSTTANTSERRRLSLLNPNEGKYYGNIDQISDGGTRNYNALLLSLQRRRANGITVQGNYTLSHCIEQSTGETPERRQENRGNCNSDRRHNVNLSTVVETPQFSNSTLRALGTGWRISGIVKLRSGAYLTILSGRDNALNGTSTDQRPDQVLEDPFAPNKSLDRFLNPAAFAQPATGTYGNVGRANVLGPGSIVVDMGLTRTFQLREGQSLEFRAEAFNLPNHLNPGNPNTTITNGNFGRILTAADPRIIQLALKYVF